MRAIDMMESLKSPLRSAGGSVPWSAQSAEFTLCSLQLMNSNAIVDRLVPYLPVSTYCSY